MQWAEPVARPTTEAAGSDTIQVMSYNCCAGRTRASNAVVTVRVSLHASKQVAASRAFPPVSVMSLLSLLLVSVFCALKTNCEDRFAGVSAVARRLLVLACKPKLGLKACKRTCVHDNIAKPDRSNHSQDTRLCCCPSAFEGVPDVNPTDFS